MDDKEAVIEMKVFLPFDSTDTQDQKALDKLEESLNELEEKHGLIVFVQSRQIQKR